MPRSNHVARAIAALTLLGGVTVLSQTAAALAPSMAPAPQGATGSGAQVWTLDFMPGDLKVYIDPTSGNAYWYFTYVVVNRTGRERMWAPTIELFDGKGNLMQTGREVPGEIHEAIKNSFKDGGVQDQFEVLGKLPIGTENGREGLCVWRAGKLDSTDLTIFVRGLSNDFKKEQPTPDAAPVTVRRSLRLDYKVGSDERATGGRAASQTGREWVYR